MSISPERHLRASTGLRGPGDYLRVEVDPSENTLQMAEQLRQAAQKQTPKQRAASIKRGMELIEKGRNRGGWRS